VKPVLIAMNNPYPDPQGRYALAPFPERSAGHRLWEMLSEVRPELYRKDYMDAFDRRNLVAGTSWSPRRAKEEAGLISFPPGSVVVMLGREVGRAFGLSPRFLHPCPDYPEEGVVVRQLPHPSGRNPFYNHPTHRLLAGLLLSELYDMSVRQ
jgi:hypothetical protein